ncbi:sorting nexin-16-like [Centruroides sculpturatus]|uniref:sorting nexin-16-like n=1 Tax=Centruroides sculpturatus TaxID=218467 RepID=UPI000C6E8D83|nr:sorting nexin-16-like [Centruroides sculpturatus]
MGSAQSTDFWQLFTLNDFRTKHQVLDEIANKDSGKYINYMKNKRALNTTITCSNIDSWTIADNDSLESEDGALQPNHSQSLCESNVESPLKNDMGSRLSCASLHSYRTYNDSCSNSDSDSTSNPLQPIFTNSTNETCTNLEYKLPIVGYEVMEERTRFTVFKIQVEHRTTGNSWFVFRRYTDFVRLHRKLKELFPSIHFALPPKKWLGDNFSPRFLEDRLHGLQNFVKNILTHKDVRNSQAQCENLEEEVFRLQQQLKDKDSEIEQLREEVGMLKSQQDALLNSLRLECALTAYAQSRNPKSPKCSENSPSHCLREAKIPNSIHQYATELQNLSRSLAQMNHKTCLMPNNDIEDTTQVNGLNHDDKK